MMQVRHPNAVRDTDDPVDGAVYVDGGRYEVDPDDATIEMQEQQAERLAERYGLTLDEIRVGDGESDGYDPFTDKSKEELIGDGFCPWCSDYSGDHVGQHASSAHPDEWAAYKED